MVNHPNRSVYSPRIPRGSTKEFVEGWKACEAGLSNASNPYRSDGSQLQVIDWAVGFDARAERGFDVSHFPRKPSGAFA